MKEKILFWGCINKIGMEYGGLCIGKFNNDYYIFVYMYFIDYMRWKWNIKLM